MAEASEKKQLTKEARKKIADSLRDPVVFAKKWLRTDVWAIQKRILHALLRYKRIAIKSCHSSGKTFTMALATLWFLARYSEGIVITTAPTAKQVEKLLWGEIHALLAKSRYPFPKPTLTELKLGPKRYAMGFTTNVQHGDEGVKFQGFHAQHILIIMDEAPGIDPAIWGAIEGACAGGDVTILAIGNPTVASGPFYDAFTSERDIWHLITISAFDTPNLEGLCVHAIDPEHPDPTNLLEMSEEELNTNKLPFLTIRSWVRNMYRKLGPSSPVYQSRVAGDFPDQSEDALISLRWLEGSKNIEAQRGKELVAGIDVAGPGEDETTLWVRDGGQLIFNKSWPIPDPRGEIVHALRKCEAEAGKKFGAVNVDSCGIGYYLGLHIRDCGFVVNLVNVGSAASDTEQYANLKAEAYWGLRMRFEEGSIGGLEDELAISQLASIRYKPKPNGQTAIESKEDARKRGVKSPDRAEGIMLCFAPVSTVAGVIDSLKVDQAKVDEMRRTGGLAKPVEAEKDKVCCPKCESTCIARVGTGLRCSQCGHQFNEKNWKLPVVGRTQEMMK